MSRSARHLAALVSLALATALLGSAPASSAPTWLEPDNLSAQGNDAFGQQVAVDAAGNATAVWSRSDGTNYRIQTSTRPAGGTWSDPFTASPEGHDAIRPQISANAAGDVALVWKQSDGVTDRIMAQHRLASGLVSMPVPLATAAQDDVGDPHVAVDGGGNFTAIWQQLAGGDRRVHARTRPPGGNWSTVDIISAAGGPARDLALSANPGASGATAIWTRDNGVDYRVQVSSRLSTTTWTAADTLSTAGQDAISPQVLVEPSGKTTAVWARSDGEAKRIQARTRLPALGWAASLIVNLSEAGQEADFPQLAVDAAGNATAVWSRSDGSHGRIQASTRPFGGAWSAVPDTLSVAGQIARDPQVAVDAAGNATAVWARFDGADYRVQSSRRPVDGAWPSPLTLSLVGEPAIEPQLAVDAAGDVTTVWDRSDSVSTRVQGIGLDVAGPVATTLAIPATGTAGQPAAMSVTATDTWSAVSSTAWSFGDGSNATGTSVSHAYAAAGTYEVSVTITDAVGNATLRTGSITVAAAPVIPPAIPPVTPPVTPPIAVAPTITTFKLKPARIRAVGSDSAARRRTRATVVLTGAAKVTLTFKKRGAKKPVAKLVKALATGKSTFKLTAKVGRKKLKPGRYVVVATTGISKKKAKLKIVR